MSDQLSPFGVGHDELGQMIGAPDYLSKTEHPAMTETQVRILEKLEASLTPGYITKDSGARTELANGMVRDTEAGKPDYTLTLDGPMFERWTGLLGRGAVKYEARNWMKALESDDPEARTKTKERFKRSAIRHMMQWLRGDTDEDHAAAVFFNINGYEAMIATDAKP